MPNGVFERGGGGRSGNPLRAEGAGGAYGQRGKQANAAERIPYPLAHMVNCGTGVLENRGNDRPSCGIVPGLFPDDFFGRLAAHANAVRNADALVGVPGEVQAGDRGDATSDLPETAGVSYRVLRHGTAASGRCGETWLWPEAGDLLQFAVTIATIDSSDSFRIAGSSIPEKAAGQDRARRDTDRKLGPHPGTGHQPLALFLGYQEAETIGRRREVGGIEARAPPSWRSCRAMAPAVRPDVGRPRPAGGLRYGLRRPARRWSASSQSLSSMRTRAAEAAGGPFNGLGAAVADLHSAANGGGDGGDHLPQAALQGAKQGRAGTSWIGFGALRQDPAGEAAVLFGEFDEARQDAPRRSFRGDRRRKCRRAAVPRDSPPSPRRSALR